MRMRPSMRENFRYLLIRVVPEDLRFDSLDLYRSVSDVVECMYGDLLSAQIWPSVILVSGSYAIIRCRRGLESPLETALATVTIIKDKPAAVHTMLTSGTVRSLREKIPKERTVRQGKVIISKTSYNAVFYSAGKIDLKENAMYHEIPRYITEEDTEDHYYDE